MFFYKHINYMALTHSKKLSFGAVEILKNKNLKNNIYFLVGCLTLSKRAYTQFLILMITETLVAILIFAITKLVISMQSR